MREPNAVDNFLRFNRQTGFFEPAWFRRDILPFWFYSDGQYVNGAITINAAGTPTPPVVYKLPHASLDRTQIEQAALNLILNATQAMPQGGTLTIATAAREPGVCVTIIDTGVGMTAETQQRLFEGFLTTKTTGTGLGLAVVRKIIDAHHGRIEVDSAPGKGATFRVFLPA